MGKLGQVDSIRAIAKNGKEEAERRRRKEKKEEEEKLGSRIRQRLSSN